MNNTLNPNNHSVNKAINLTHLHHTEYNNNP